MSPLQAVEFGDVQRVFQSGATGAAVKGNHINPATGYEVGTDAPSRAGYQGPAPGGKP